MGCLIIGMIFGVLGVVSIFWGIEDGDTVLTVIGILFVLPAVLAILAMLFGNTEKAKKEQADAKNRFENKIKKKFEEEAVEITQEYITSTYSIVGIDENNRKVCFLTSDSDMDLKSMYTNYDLVDGRVDFTARTFPYKDILESEVLIDGETVTKTSRSSQIGGAILGGILAGGVGAVIGGLSGKTASKEKVKTIQLKVIVNDLTNPLQLIPFLTEPNAIDRTNQKFIAANKDVMHWHSIFKVIIDRADKEEKTKQVVQSDATSADEIRKLYALFKEGIITEEEFDVEKKKIINTI